MTILKEFPILYCKSANKKTKKWEIEVIPDENKSLIISKFGYLDGKTRIFECEITKGKNINKKNETTHYKQALIEANSKFNKKKDEGYIEYIEKDDEFKINVNKTNTIYPMLALNYSSRSHNINFDCYIQPKIDGCRGIFYNKMIYSRKGKEFINLIHIIEEIHDCPFVLDGELYSNIFNFQDFCGLIKKKKIDDEDKENMKHIVYIIYDIVSDEDFEERYNKLKKYFDKNKFKYVKLLLTEECKNRDEINKKKDEYIKNGYEGIIIRNKIGKYKQNCRSPDLQKYKNFFDKEYEIIGYKKGEGVENGCVIWICKTDEGNKFNVRPSGKFEERKSIYKNADKYVGKMLTVKYQELSSDNVPRFPVGITIRDYE